MIWKIAVTIGFASCQQELVMVLDGLLGVTKLRSKQLLSNEQLMPLSSLRNGALAVLDTVGLPTPKHEEWKYINIIPSFNGLQRALEAETQAPFLNETLWQQQLMSAMGDCVVVQLLPDGLCTTTNNNGSVAAWSIADALQDSELFAVVQESISQREHHAFSALATSTLWRGAVVRCVAQEKPSIIHIRIPLYEQFVVSAPCIVLDITPGFRGTVVVSLESNAHSPLLCVPQVYTRVGENSAVEIITLHEPNDELRLIHQCNAVVGRGARLMMVSICGGVPLERNDVNVVLQQPTAEAYLYGATTLHGNEVADNHTVVDHAVPHCFSEELYKGVYSNNSKGVFNGKIFVREQAQKTVAYQSSHAMLLHSTAQMNAKPQLEIWADDVKCSHGATCGMMNAEALFYLRSRGLSEDQAKEILIEAFIIDVLEHVSLEPLRSFIAEHCLVIGARPTT
jgi:Fe-S cluster assembly protein SufD